MSKKDVIVEKIKTIRVVLTTSYLGLFALLSWLFNFYLAASISSTKHGSVTSLMATGIPIIVMAMLLCIIWIADKKYFQLIGDLEEEA